MSHAKRLIEEQLDRVCDECGWDIELGLGCPKCNELRPLSSPNSCSSCGASCQTVTRPGRGKPFRQCQLCGQIQDVTFPDLGRRKSSRPLVLKTEKRSAVHVPTETDCRHDDADKVVSMAHPTRKGESMRFCRACWNWIK